ncbi:MAG TPA: signal peptidase I [Nitriliruptorales bacterium]|nr:signal peptidase I [Nitriliruptorales bacterium]
MSVACAFYLAVVVVLAAWTLLPVLVGWRPMVIVSGSMQPRVQVGDIVLVDAYDGDPLGAGTVVNFTDPTQPGRVVTHRIAASNPDGTYTTKGDANPTPDSAHIPPDAIHGVARLLVPSAGLPVVWLSNGRYDAMAVWALGTILAFGSLPSPAAASPRFPSWVAARGLV